MGNNKPAYLPSLDGTRGFALILVLMSHSMLIRFGWVGVDIFFILSGFLITRILWEEKQRPVDLGTKVKHFWIRRVLRIFPMYLPYITGLAIFWYLSGQWDQQSLRVLSLFTYTYNFYGIAHSVPPNYFTGHLWSLSVEEQFYILYPFLILLAGRTTIKKTVISLFLLAIIYRFSLLVFLQSNGTDPHRMAGLIYSSTLSHLDGFMLGAMIALFEPPKMNEGLAKLGWPFFGLFLLMLGWVVYLLSIPGSFEFNAYASHLGWDNSFTGFGYPVWSYLLVNLFFAYSYLLLIHFPRTYWGIILDRFFQTPFLVFLGRISYGLYIIHMLVRRLLVDQCKEWGIHNKYLLFLLYFPVVVSVGWFFYRFYEKRFLLMKRKYH